LFIIIIIYALIKYKNMLLLSIFESYLFNELKCMVVSVSIQHDMFMKHVIWIATHCVNSLSKQIMFSLKGFDMIIKWIMFMLTHVVEYHYLNMT
jgi:hypothetical protein